eukprot:6172835-Pleurochrysis_carterae.AAC.2
MCSIIFITRSYDPQQRPDGLRKRALRVVSNNLQRAVGHHLCREDPFLSNGANIAVGKRDLGGRHVVVLSGYLNPATSEKFQMRQLKKNEVLIDHPAESSIDKASNITVSRGTKQR